MAGTMVNLGELVGVIALFATIIFAGLEAMSKLRAAPVHNARRMTPNPTRGSL